MQLEEYLRALLPPGGRVSISKKQQRGTNTVWTPTWVTSVEDAAKFIRSADKASVYVSIAAYEEGNKRDAEHAKASRMWLIDLDCGEGKPFASKAEALTSLAGFLKQSKVPLPTFIVDTGHGIHAYWSVETPVFPDHWRTIADALRNAAKTNGLQVDDITNEITRSFRPIESFNFRNPSDPQPVKLLKTRPTQLTLTELATALAPYANAAPVDNSDLSFEYPKDAYMQHVVQNCNMMSEIAAAHGRGVPEPMWFHTLALCARSIDGEQWIHAISDGHESYSQRATETKYATIVRSSYNAPTCATLQDAAAGTGYCDSCNKCPYRGSVKSPIQLGTPANKATIKAGLPPGYIQNDDGIYRVKNKEAGEYIPVLPGWIHEAYLITTKVSDPLGEGVALKYSTRETASVSELIIPMQQMCDGRTLLKFVFQHGIAVKEKQRSEFQHFMSTWLTQLQNTTTPRRITNSMGWVYNDELKLSGFALGTEAFWSDGTATPTSPPDDTIAGVYTPKGTIEPWQECADFIIKQGRMELVTLLASSFAAPLMRFTGVHGALLSIVSAQSGKGKSSAMNTAQAVWGSPKLGKNSLDDTANAISKKMAITQALPAYWDELRRTDRSGESIYRFTNLVFKLGQGKDKSRLSANTDFQHAGEWTTMLVAASNHSLKDYISTTVGDSDAGVLRVFELTLADYDDTGADVPELTRMFGALDSNYGHVGLRYAQWLAVNESRLQEMLSKTSRALDQRLGTKPNERFWLATCSTLLLGASIATQLGLARFDVRSLMEYLIERFDDMRGGREDNVKSAETILNEFLTDKIDERLVTSRVHVGRGRPPVVTVMLDPRRAPTHQIGTQDGRLLVLERPFRNWLEDNRYGVAHCETLRMRYGIVDGEKRGEKFGAIGTGTKWHTPGQQKCLLIDLHRAGLSDVVTSLGAKDDLGD